MLQRLCVPPKNQSFFLFGARGTGKSTLLRSLTQFNKCLYIDLLRPSHEEIYSLDPEALIRQTANLTSKDWVVIDEVQKCPKLLDVVHSLIEEKKIKFALTGSSSRKLKRGGANLLAGRAVVFSMFPLTYFELQNKLSLTEILNWGTLPKILEFKTDLEKNRYLKSYVHTYLKEEVQVEQVVRKLEPFRLFLPIAAQMDGQILNYSKIARDVGTDHKTIANYYQILVDTNLGFFLDSYHKSIRKVQHDTPRFYFFDTGVKRALERQINVPLQPKTTLYGNAFEAWIINECHRYNSYYELDYTFSYLRTKDDAEIDLIIETPSKKTFLVEIKSSKKIDTSHLKHLKSFKKDFKEAEFICACDISKKENHEGIQILPWREALTKIFNHV
jgi:predicted AAA+ superfamily ATPase